MIIGAVLLFAGCYSGSIEDLYSLPKTSEKYVVLQNLINEEIASGSEFSAPTRGSYRQSVQQYDIDGDGVDEMFAFFLDSAKSLKICVYTGDGEDGGYRLSATITGEGTSIGAIEYADIDGDGVADLTVAWQSGTGDMRLLQSFAMGGFQGTPLLTVNCSEFLVSDFDGDGVQDVAVMRYGDAEDANSAGEVELHSFPPEGEPRSSGARMSRGLGHGMVTRMRAGLLSDMTPALYIEGLYGENEIITDIFACRDGEIRNITLNPKTRTSSDTLRFNYREPYSRDIDNDRSLETPVTVPMYAPENTSVYYYLNWYSFDADGKRNLDLSTYHSPDGWYLILSEGWRANLTVRRSDGAAGERAIILSTYTRNSGLRDFLTIYTLTGDNRHDRARVDDRFVLYEDDTTIYAAKILRTTAEWTYAVSADEVRERFRLIYSEWTTGAI